MLAPTSAATNSVDQGVIGLAEALGEPALLVAGNGALLHANRPARLVLGVPWQGRSLMELHRGSRADLETFLRRALGSTSPLMGAVDLASGHHHCRGSRVDLGDRAVILLRLGHRDEQRFRALQQQLAVLDREVRERQQAREILAETVRERDVLLKELQHRVKNNMQMLAGILHGAEQEASHTEVRDALREAGQRFAAIGAVHQLLYESSAVDELDAGQLVAALTGSVEAIQEGTMVVECSGPPVRLRLDAATPLALILNELLTNAIKHGRPRDGSPRMVVRLRPEESHLTLVVADNGPGFDADDSARRASGLGLVRALVRQLGGSIRLDQRDGACWTIRFSLDRVARGGAS